MGFKILPEDKAPEKSFGETLKEVTSENLRAPARIASNLTSLGLGFPGDVAGLVNDLAVGPLVSKITGEKAIPYEQTFLGKALPTSKQHKENLRLIAPEYLSPKGRVEEFTDAVIDDTALLLVNPLKTKLPYGKTISEAQKLVRSLGTSLGANVAGEAVRDITGGDENKATIAKLGTLFALSIVNKPKAAELASQLYKDAEAALPAGASQDARRLNNYLVGLKSSVSKGTLAPSEKFIVDETNALLAKIKKGKISVEEAQASKRSLGEKLQKHLFENPDKKAQARARKLATGIQKELGNVIEDYGKTNPKYESAYKQAEEAFSTIAKSNFVSRFVEKNLKYTPFTSGLLHAFGGGIAGTAASSILPYQSAKIVYRIAKSPVLRKHYNNVIKASIKQDAVIANKELKLLDEQIQNSEKKDKFKIID